MPLSKIQITNNQVIPNLGRRNLIINGAMQVAQRGTSTTNSNGYGVDRFRGNVSAMDELAQTLAQNSVTDLPGFTKSLKVTTTTGESSIASNELFREMYFIEGQDLQHLKYGTPDAKTITLSFYVKSTVTGTFACSIYADTNSRMIGGTYTINSANTWEKKTLSFAGDTGSVIGNDNTEGLRINWILAAGSDNTSANNTSWGSYSGTKLAYGHVTNSVITTTNASWEITGVQLEVGDSASDFENRSFAEELALCKRYFQVVRQGIMGECMNANGTCNWWYEFPVQMRAVPSIVCTKTVYRYGDMVAIGVEMTSISVSAGGYRSEKTAIWNVTGTKSATPVQYRIQLLEPQNANHGDFQFSAEL